MAAKRKSGFEELVGALRKTTECRHGQLMRSTSPADAARWWETIGHCVPYMAREHLRWLGRHDLWFLLVYLLNRRHFVADERKEKWTFDRCEEVQLDPNNHLDLWHREGFKSEIITFGKTIQDILVDPEITFGFFSHTRPMAKDFLTLIKREFEFNELLKQTYDDILWQDPKYECRAASVSWSENEGITVKRRGNPKESTIEAYGLTDGQPTGKRYKVLVYDDVVSRDMISPLMIQLTTEQFDNSLLLTASDPVIFRYVGTFQEFGDTSQQLIQRGVGKLRLHSALDEDNKPACLSDEKFGFFKQTLPPKVFALQVLLDPTQAKAPDEVGFNRDWMEFWDPKDDSLVGWNVYIAVDPAGNNPDSNSFFALWVVALGPDKHIRIVDGLFDKYDLEERWQAVFEMVQKYNPLKVGYEKVAMQADIEHFRWRMKELNQIFTIVQLGGGMSKDGRIGWLLPLFRDRRILFPREGIKKKLKNGTELDLVREFIDQEFLLWPYNSRRRDMLDALSRFLDPAFGVVYPRRYGASFAEYNSGGPFGGNRGGNSGSSWMSE